MEAEDRKADMKSQVQKGAWIKLFIFLLAFMVWIHEGSRVGTAEETIIVDTTGDVVDFGGAQQT